MNLKSALKGITIFFPSLLPIWCQTQKNIAALSRFEYGID
jgi:hypothetical protein